MSTSWWPGTNEIPTAAPRHRRSSVANRGRLDQFIARVCRQAGEGTRSLVPDLPRLKDVTSLEGTSTATSTSTTSLRTTTRRPEDDYPAALGLWIAEMTGGPVPRFKKVEQGEPTDGVVIEGDDV
jgi:hypothetical protein